MNPHDYQIRDVNLYRIRNRNEIRVVRTMKRMLQERPDLIEDRMDIEDVYALALNKLPPRYTQSFSIVLNEPVSDKMIEEAIEEAINIVLERPTRPNKVGT